MLIEEVRTAFGRVVVVHVPSRLPGTAWSDEGRYLQQTEDGVASIPTDALRTLLLDEIPVARAEADDRILARSDEELLAKADLLVDRNLTFAALILLGSRAALLRWLPQAEVVVERGELVEIDRGHVDGVTKPTARQLVAATVRERAKVERGVRHDALRRSVAITLAAAEIPDRRPSSWKPNPK